MAKEQQKAQENSTPVFYSEVSTTAQEDACTASDSELNTPEQAAREPVGESGDHPPPDNRVIAPDVGRKITFDNLDYHQEVHYMTEENQNVDKHCVTMMSTENRVSGSHLSNEPLTDGVLEMENGNCLPSHLDNAKQRENYVILVERIISTNVPCLNFLLDVTTPHIPHCYRREMKNKSETVSTRLWFILSQYINFAFHVLFAE